MQDNQPVATIDARCEQRVYPPYDALHGTPHPMLRRTVTITTPQGKASLEQSDYGHPGRMNPWEPRGIAPALVPMLAKLITVAGALAALHPGE